MNLMNRIRGSCVLFGSPSALPEDHDKRHR
jgi:hypothetical protein